MTSARMLAWPSPVGWRMAAAGAAAVLVAVAALAPVEPAAERDGSRLRALPALPAERAAAETAYPSITEHPLFSPMRKPWEPPPPPAAPKPVTPPPPPVPAARQPPQGYTLVGLVLSDGVRLAVLRTGTRTLTLAEGGQLDGWTLREVGSNGLRFEADGAQFDLGFPLPKPADPKPRPF